MSPLRPPPPLERRFKYRGELCLLVGEPFEEEARRSPPTVPPPPSEEALLRRWNAPGDASFAASLTPAAASFTPATTPPMVNQAGTKRGSTGRRSVVGARMRVGASVAVESSR